VQCQSSESESEALGWAARGNWRPAQNNDGMCVMTNKGEYQTYSDYKFNTENSRRNHCKLFGLINSISSQNFLSSTWLLKHITAQAQLSRETLCKACIIRNQSHAQKIRLTNCHIIHTMSVQHHQGFLLFPILTLTWAMKYYYRCNKKRELRIQINYHKLMRAKQHGNCYNQR